MLTNRARFLGVALLWTVALVLAMVLSGCADVAMIALQSLPGSGHGTPQCYQDPHSCACEMSRGFRCIQKR